MGRRVGNGGDRMTIPVTAYTLWVGSKFRTGIDFRYSLLIYSGSKDKTVATPPWLICRSESLLIFSLALKSMHIV